MVPPAPNGTTMRMGFTGNRGVSAATAVPAAPVHRISVSSRFKVERPAL